MGYDTLLMPDHFGARLALAPALVVAAQATAQLRVGSLVYDNDFRHPAVLAQEVASIDLLSNGRFDLGIGAGWLKSEYDAAGLPFDSGRVRVERLAEALTLIKAMLRGEPVSHEGSHYRLHELTGAARSVQQPHPPVLIGGGGRRLLALAAREADIISVMPRSRADGGGLEVQEATPAGFAEKIEWIKAAAGSRFQQLVLNTLVQQVTLTDDPEAEAARLATEWNFSPAEVLSSPLLLIGSATSLAELLRRRRRELGISYLTVFEKDVEPFARVIEAVRALPVSAG